MYNIVKSSLRKQRPKVKADVQLPPGPIYTLAALGTGIFFLESVLYIILVLSGFHSVIGDSCFQLEFLFASEVQVIGIFATAFGYGLFLWSVLARGVYATSWDMPENQKLVTWGPYRYVRHPSYLAYFILFVGLFFVLLNLVALIPFIAVPGYLHVVSLEEELLIERFGKEFLEYQQKTGRFFPRMRRDNRL